MNLMCALKKAFHKIPRYRNIDAIKFYLIKTCNKKQQITVKQIKYDKAFN